MNKEIQGLKDKPPQSNGTANGLRWTVAVIDFVFGFWLSYLSLFILFLRRGSDIFTEVPDEFSGIILGGYAFWILYAGYRLLTEDVSIRWRNGKQRHLLTIGFSILLILGMWMAALVDSHDGFGPAMGVVIYTFVLGVFMFFLLLAVLGMSQLAAQSPPANKISLFDRLKEELKPPSERDKD